MVEAEILAIGSELLTPERIDTNSLWLTAQLNEIGIEVVAKSIVGDHRPRLCQSLLQALSRSQVVICTGGLGPTEDDVTRDAAAEALGVQQIFRDDLWVELQDKFTRVGRTAPTNNRRQALVLEGAESLPNPNGTAPGQYCPSSGGVLVLLPGPPRELKPMFLNHVLPRLRPLAGGQVLTRRTLKVYGLGESALDEKLAPLYPQFPEVVVTTLFTPLDLEVHLSAAGSTPQECQAKIQPLEEEMRRVLGVYCYGTEQQSLAEVVGSLLQEQACTLVTAESLTGGLVAQRITDVAGSSQYFLGSWVTYTDSFKHAQLGVPLDTLEHHGAVSAATAEAMALAARQRSGADLALSLTGFAGPSGGTAENPVGTVYLGLARAHGAESKRLSLPGDRELIRSRAAQAGLDWIRRSLCP